VRIAIDAGGLDVVLREPCDGFIDGGEEGVDAEEDRGFLVEGDELGFPEIAEFGVAELVDPIGDGLADGAGLVGEGFLAGDDFRGREAVVLVPFGQLVAHENPLGGDERVGFLGIDKVGEDAAPAGCFEESFCDEGAVALAPFRVFIEGGGELVVGDSVVDQDGFGEFEG